MNKILFGRYIPLDSFVHRMDPRSKLILSFLYVIVIFFANNWWIYLLMAVVAFVSILASKINFKLFVDGVMPLLWIIAFTMVIQILFGTGGQTYWHWGIFSITSVGILNAAYIFVRFTLIILISTLLTLSTSPIQISDALESLLMPLRKIHFPVYEVALMLSIALRFVPSLMDETETIMNAQRARGVDFGTGNIIQRLKKIIPILIPLFVSAFNRAEDLATAMEARGYRGGAGRTKYRLLKWETRDTLATLVYSLMAIGVFALRLL
ncbi:Transmembrane component of general energizing module of ECF transporter [Pediococcus damnosus]|uniref:Energy-coupling factor transporter transmembrane protein EcfT n=1 Tax=Pediococcus damnosus TaxID=51663 RepID=A0A0R2HE88_9LACO|nr:energy-coupling factor transporter transmembrane component T [Pediococcus damnosus]AMV63717.1 Transmembrane component of general energizing module of ECF transporter [Pediococcus damnosus]AMV66343.1 Transmembrane component of general energizing module of ECF transporter [Pediococcus damnosus]KRN51346.1 abc-type cobalt transport system, permease component cbiq related transporter [Pediococcus damnosus]PJE50038.1 energy-coupling factor transporter transmembrane protein EcfT [Pediococcus damnos